MAGFLARAVAVCGLLLLAMGQPKDPKVIEYKQRVKKLKERWETRRFKKQCKRVLRDEIFGGKRLRTKRRRAMVQRRAEAISPRHLTAENGAGSLREFVAKHRDLEISRDDTAGTGRAKVVVRSTGKAFEFMPGTEDESVVVSRVWHYVTSKKYARAVVASSSTGAS
mmetsp:Transcript_34823/g.64465  ORF Transcript_34823/g.64465 Transcript_34823/m.64465 type:complete len:167 (-) Transcript_34823:90-590(-)|eukprot:CAMPEP_0170168200 /NCGR_PEP_ID=MMETSP0040_2-20121228/1335_1 /TAXON_ID=641309 /ORGANISM="Lotharella oceanica, Strain CCMP622" /LENGTH=166 /DNA_ID=CAMNT_0010406403 /DNA_START=38 /DNA_END=538 /DNA_ORIENTATION=+